MTAREQATVGKILARLDEQEKVRVEIRERDTHWRERMEAKTDKMSDKMDSLPELIDNKIRACREEREATTEAAELLATREAVKHGLFSSLRTSASFWVSVGVFLSGIAFFVAGQA